MQRYLLFDAGCHVFQIIADKTENISDGWLMTRSLTDPEMQVLLSKAKENWRWEPTLLEVEENSVHVSVGIALRIKLLFGMGPQRAWKMVRFMHHAIETERAVNHPRRHFFVRSGAILSGVLLGVDLEASGTYTAQNQSKYRYTQLSPTAAHSQLGTSQTFHEAAQHLGSPDWNHVYAYTSTNNAEKGIVTLYPTKVGKEHASTFLAIDDPSAGGSRIALVGEWAIQGKQQATLTWSTHRGEHLAAQVFQNGQKATRASLKVSLQADFNVECFLGCIGASVDTGCITSCINCIGASGVNCAICGICAGPAGIA